MAEETTQGQAELTALRQRYYGMFVALLWSEPGAETILALGEGLQERAENADHLQQKMGEGWRVIGQFLQGHTPDAVADEFTVLFLGPRQPEVSPYESQYLTGMLYKEPLIEVREFMKSVGLEKSAEDYAEPEDMIAFELEIMNWLVSREGEAKSEEEAAQWRLRQAEFFKKHLQVWGPTCARDLQEAEHAAFYRGVGLLLEGFLLAEGQGFHDVGEVEALSLEEARRKYKRRPVWKGETYDPESLPAPGGKVEN